MKRSNRGFTLIEVMITVVIIGILTAVALPSYSDYLTRGRVSEAFSALGAAQASAEQFWTNTRDYTGFNAPGTGFPADTPNFTFALSGVSAAGYTLTATGRAQALGFIYTIDQQGNRATTFVPAGWTANSTCWVDRRGGKCSQ